MLRLPLTPNEKLAHLGSLSFSVPEYTLMKSWQIWVLGVSVSQITFPYEKLAEFDTMSFSVPEPPPPPHTPQ